MSPKRLLALTAALALGCFFPVNVVVSAIVDDFESHNGTGETSPPAGWTLIAVPGPGGGSYVSTVGSLSLIHI